MNIRITTGLHDMVVSDEDWTFVFWRLVEYKGYRPEYIHSQVSATKVEYAISHSVKELGKALLEWFKL